MKTEIFKDYFAFAAREDKEVNGQTQEFSDSDLRPNENCKGCWNCSDCSGLRNALPVADSKPEENPLLNIPIVPNIHQKVLALVKEEGAFDMGNWINPAQTACGMTYCRGGAAILAAGDAGKKLKDLTSFEFAEMMIYKASSHIKVSPVRFYEDNKNAMKDIVRCASEESKAT